MTQSLVIKTTALNYAYSRREPILQDIHLEVAQGSIYGFLGPNGSGKTTTLSLILGLLTMQQGSIELFGKQLAQDRIGILKRVGSLIETPSLYGHLTATENLEVYRPVYGVSRERINEVLKIVELEYAGNKTVKRFSLGMKQRLAIALALLNRPELLILDEPTNGLDPNGMIEFRQLIRKLNKMYGMTIIISSHILAEVEKMVTHLGIISKGKMLFQGSLKELPSLQQHQARLHVHTSDNEAAIRFLQEFKPARDRDRLLVEYTGIGQVAEINRILTRNELDVYLLHPKEHSLEQLFIDLTTIPNA
ncbi:MAG: ABC transporter ATP-binding protein [Ferruginibacter sp.]|nr:ABC transporter ATP-binding protein [Ferruginibacter sp.]